MTNPTRDELIAAADRYSAKADEVQATAPSEARQADKRAARLMESLAFRQAATNCLLGALLTDAEPPTPTPAPIALVAEPTAPAPRRRAKASTAAATEEVAA